MVWEEIAHLLMTEDLSGHRLLMRLRAEFPHAKRDDVYRAIAYAWTYQQAGWLGDRLELDGLRGPPGAPPAAK